MANYVIIGGSSGIGKDLVSILDVNDNQIFSTYFKNETQSLNNISYQKFDVLNDDLDTSNFPEEINGLVYCPGSINLKSFNRFTEYELIEDFRLQVTGATKVINNILPRLKRSDNSSIVMFSTIAVQLGFNYHSQVSISKGAIEGLTKALAAEFAPTIRVNAIAPSLTNTALSQKFLNTTNKINSQSDKNPLKRIGNVRDIAEATAYLLSPKSSWITGQIFHVDGGFSTIK